MKSLPTIASVILVITFGFSVGLGVGVWIGTQQEHCATEKNQERTFHRAPHSFKRTTIITSRVSFS